MARKHPERHRASVPDDDGGSVRGRLQEPNKSRSAHARIRLLHPSISYEKVSPIIEFRNLRRLPEESGSELSLVILMSARSLVAKVAPAFGKVEQFVWMNS